MRRLFLLAVCALVLAGCEKSAPTTEAQPGHQRRMIKAGDNPAAPVTTRS